MSSHPVPTADDIRQAIAQARDAYANLEDLANSDGDFPPPVPHLPWACALTAIALDGTPGAAEVLNGHTDSKGRVWPRSLAAARVFAVATETEMVLATPAVLRSIEVAGGRLLGQTPICWGPGWTAEGEPAADDGQVLATVMVTLIPIPLTGARGPGVPQGLQTTLSAGELYRPLVFLTAHQVMTLPSPLTWP